ncbi:MAG: hypothetical protein ACKOGA_00955, partial [Planctomycetaceae bacterium]
GAAPRPAPKKVNAPEKTEAVPGESSEPPQESEGEANPTDSSNEPPQADQPQATEPKSESAGGQTAGSNPPE